MTWTTPDLAECQPNITPLFRNVLVAMAEAPKMTASGLHLPPPVQDREQFGCMEARVIAVSQHAFTYAQDWLSAPPPRAGDLVLIGKYAGTDVKGADGKTYKLVEDESVTAVLNTPQAENPNG